MCTFLLHANKTETNCNPVNAEIIQPIVLGIIISARYYLGPASAKLSILHLHIYHVLFGKPFRAILAGGGPAGLILAHCLNAAGIDFVFLERRAVIVKPSGAALAIWPNCARLLDQLGLFERARDLCKPSNSSTSYNRNGRVLKKLPFYTFLEERYEH
jgi:hypothetical protein